MRILVTGAAGFIGVNFGRRFGDIHELIGLDNLTVGSREDALDSNYARLIEADIRDEPALAAACDDVECVVHLAAQTGVPASLSDPWTDLENNVVGSFRVLRAAHLRSVDRVVLASSAAPLGSVSPPAHELLCPQPLSPYGASKLAMEAYASAFNGSYELGSYVLRFSNVYGPWSYLKGSVVARWMKELGEGRPITINGDGDQTRDFVHVDDICNAIMLAAEGTKPCGLYQLGTGVETSVLELAHHMTELFGVGVEDAVQFGPALAGEVPRSYCDISKAQAELGYEPVRTIPEGLVSTKDWFERYVF